MRSLSPGSRTDRHRRGPHRLERVAGARPVMAVIDDQARRRPARPCARRAADERERGAAQTSGFGPRPSRTKRPRTRRLRHPPSPSVAAPAARRRIRWRRPAGARSRAGSRDRRASARGRRSGWAARNDGLVSTKWTRGASPRRAAPAARPAPACRGRAPARHSAMAGRAGAQSTRRLSQDRSVRRTSG